MSVNKTVAFYTLGCKVNQYETEVIKKDFIENGYSEVEFEKISDVYVINTCTVTSVADKKNRKMIRRAKSINPNAVVVVTGCYAQTNNNELSKMLGIDYIIGNTKKENVYDIVSKEQEKIQVTNIFEDREYSHKKYSTLREKARAFVKIQDGCNKFCSYCKIPYARGKSRSRGIENIMEEIQELSKEGFKEIIVTGINMSEYGLDLFPQTNFDDVLEKILAIDGIERVRVSSVYPDTLTDKFIYLLKTNKKLMPHLHVSIQNLDDIILKSMKRSYNAHYVIEILSKIKNEIPDLSITADIIVGFTGETEEQFQNTVNNVEQIEFTDLHVFPYSDREKTAASLMLNKIDQSLKKERVRKIEKLMMNKSNEFRKKQIGKERYVYVEEVKDGYAIGHTENYLKTKIKLNNEIIKISDTLKVIIKNFKQDTLEGEII